MSVVNVENAGESIAKMISSAKETLISGISNIGSRVAISGIVLFYNNDSFLIDDGSSQARVIFSNLNLLQGAYIRAFGVVISIKNGVELQAEIVQDLSNIDKKLHRRLKEILE